MPAPIEQWWPLLSPEARDRLVADNGDAVPASVVDEITRAGGPAATDAWWVVQDGSTGLHLPDAAVDWVEAVANDETPDAAT